MPYSPFVQILCSFKSLIISKKIRSRVHLFFFLFLLEERFHVNVETKSNPNFENILRTHWKSVDEIYFDSFETVCFCSVLWLSKQQVKDISGLNGQI